ncbi:MAG: hypothetical protein ACMUIP_00385 [bacterium]
MDARKNIFIADDILIKTGYVLLFLALLGGFTVWSSMKTGTVNPGDARIVVLVILGLVMMPIAFLAIGYRIRSQEKKICTVWNILEKTLEASIDDLAENTGLQKETIVKALRRINRRGSAYFIYDRPSGLIFDGRLKSQTIGIKNCPSCGHSIGYTIPLVVTTLPHCNYCNSPLDISYINRLKQERIESILGVHSASRANVAFNTPKSSFSWGVFVMLLLIFWPAALAYAYLKNGKAG